MNRQYYFIRHALPVNDAGSFHISVFDRDMMGEVDEGLSEKGKRQAAVLTPMIQESGAERLVSSTRKRAIETAEIISEGSGLHYQGRLPSLVEINLGSYPVNKNLLFRFMMSTAWPRFMRGALDRIMADGLTFHYFIQWQRGKTQGADTITAINERIDDGLKVLDSLPQERIAVVGHAGWITFMAIRIRAESMLRLARIFRVGNCSVTRVDADGTGGYRLRYFAKNALKAEKKARSVSDGLAISD